MLTWYKEGERLEQNEKYEIDELTGRLLFVTVDLEDSGTYLLRADNSAGYDESQIELTILQRPNVFTEKDVYEFTAGESYTIDLDISGIPTPKVVLIIFCMANCCKY